MKLHGKRVLVIGLGESGLAMAKWLHRQGAHVRVADTRAHPPNTEGLRAAVPEVEIHAGGLPAAVFSGVDLIALSPGVALGTPEIQAAGLPVVSEVELFVWGLRMLAEQGRQPGRVLAITGSNGKTTTTALTAHLLNQAGVRAMACGNISPSVLDALMEALDGQSLPQVWVLELSSFQLEATHTLNADAATVLNVSEDHLDRHDGMAAYAEAKARIFQGHPVRVLNRDDVFSRAMTQADAVVLTFGLNPPTSSRDYGLRASQLCRGDQALLALADSPLQGLHNAANLMAALALCEAIGYSAETVLPGLASFRGLPHRVETIAELGGVSYVDDSKGTNVGATLAAIEGMGRKVAIVLGGDGKGQDFAPLKPALQAHGRAVALIGRDAETIARALEGCGLPTARFADMAGAVNWLAEQAMAGDCVLLSPACASLDMYRNYAHRAEAFCAAVAELDGKGR